MFHMPVFVSGQSTGMGSTCPRGASPASPASPTLARIRCHLFARPSSPSLFSHIGVVSAAFSARPPHLVLGCLYRGVPAGCMRFFGIVEICRSGVALRVGHVAEELVGARVCRRVLILGAWCRLRTRQRERREQKRTENNIELVSLVLPY